jgi:tetratricopeptide (TPR) repeat protein
MKESKEIREIKAKASEYISAGLYKEALRELEKLLNYPEAVDGALYQRIGELQKKVGNKEKAIEYYLKAVEDYKKHHAYSHLVALYRKILEIEPKRKEFLFELADAYYHIGMTTEAAKALQEYADSLYKEGEIERAFEVYKNLLNVVPENILLKRKIAELFLLHNLFKDAWKLYKEIFEHYKKIGKEDKLVEIKEKLEEIEIIIGEEIKELEEEASFKEEEEEKEEKEFISVEDLIEGKKKSIKDFIEPKEKEGIEEISEIKETAEEIQKKEESVKEISEVKETVEEKIKYKKWEAELDMADAYLDLGEKDIALELYYSAGETLFKEQDFMNAIKVFKKIIDLFPFELKARQKLVEIAQRIKDKNLLVEALLELANCLYERGDKEKAKIWYLQILKRADPNCKEAKERLSIIAPEVLEKIEKTKEKVKEPEIKMEEIKKEVIEEPKIISEEGFIDLGKEIREELEKEEKKLSKEEEKIFEEMKESIYSHAENVDPTYALEVGIAMKDLGIFDEAITNLKKALKGDNKIKKDAYYYLGQIFIEIKKPDLAVENFLNALNIKTEDEERDRAIHYEIGLAYEMMEKWTEALKHYKILYEKDPSYKEIKQKIIELAKKIKSIKKE